MLREAKSEQIHGCASVDRRTGWNSETEFRLGAMLGKPVPVLRKTAGQNEGSAVGRRLMQFNMPFLSST